MLVHGQLHKGERIQAPRDPDPDAGTQISQHRTAVRTIRLHTAFTLLAMQVQLDLRREAAGVEIAQAKIEIELIAGTKMLARI